VGAGFSAGAAGMGVAAILLKRCMSMSSVIVILFPMLRGMRVGIQDCEEDQEWDQEQE
jgi:hypothetical protein